jgi:hypothetical protein
VLALIGLSTAYYFAYGPFETASPPFVRGQLGATEGAYSLLWALFGIGALATLTALQRWVSPARHGAVFGLQRSLLSVATPFGAAVAAIALQEVAPRTVLAASAGGCALAGILALASRDLRRDGVSTDRKALAAHERGYRRRHGLGCDAEPRRDRALPL